MSTSRVVLWKRWRTSLTLPARVLLYCQSSWDNVDLVSQVSDYPFITRSVTPSSAPLTAFAGIHLQAAHSATVHKAAIKLLPQRSRQCTNVTSQLYLEQVLVKVYSSRPSWRRQDRYTFTDTSRIRCWGICNALCVESSVMFGVSPRIVINWVLSSFCCCLLLLQACWDVDFLPYIETALIYSLEKKFQDGRFDGFIVGVDDCLRPTPFKSFVKKVWLKVVHCTSSSQWADFKKLSI